MSLLRWRMQLRMQMLLKRWKLQDVKILIGGSSGFVGRRLVHFFQEKGHGVFHLFRSGSAQLSDAVVWDPQSGQISPHSFDGFDAVIHLAGKNLMDKRWTKAVKKEIFQSRCRDTWLLAQGILRASTKPKVLITASAVGYYGNRAAAVVDEKAPKGEGFLADVCDHWERATEGLMDSTRVVHARFGVVLSPEGGMLSKIAPFFRSGLGAVLGNGEQWMSWIALNDLVNGIDHILKTETLKGPVNLCSPHPVQNVEFCRFLSESMHRKCFLRIPPWLLKLLVGESAIEMLLSSTRAIPSKLQGSGFSFGYPTLPQLFQAFGYN